MNTTALNSHSAMNTSGRYQAVAPSTRPSGMRLNTFYKSQSSLWVSKKNRYHTRSFDVATKNAIDGTEMVNTAEFGLQQVSNLLQRTRELIIFASNDTNNDKDRNKISKEILQLFEEIDNIVDIIVFKDKKLINGSFAQSKIHFQIGPYKNQFIQFNIGCFDVNGLGLNEVRKSVSTLSSMDGVSIINFLSSFDEAIDRIMGERIKLWSVQMRLRYSMKKLDISSENLSASCSRILNTSMASEMLNQTRTNILAQPITSILAQSNHQPLRVLQALGTFGNGLSYMASLRK